MYVDETITIWTDSETTKYLSNNCWLLLLLTVKIAVRVTDFVIERDSECPDSQGCCCCFASACQAKQACAPFRAINCFVLWGTEAIPRVHCSRLSESEIAIWIRNGSYIQKSRVICITLSNMRPIFGYILLQFWHLYFLVHMLVLNNL